MSKGRLLVVEDDFDISNMLRIYFDSQGYETIIATRGEEALDLCRRKLPNLVILDIMLPDINGYEVCRSLRNNLRTSHIPIIFLTQRDERSDQIAGLELGADDYITKPFDLQLLLLRVEGALRRAGWLSLTSPVTGLPSSKLIEEQLREIMRRKDWSILYIGINHINGFNDVYGFVAGDDVLRFTSMLLIEVVDEVGTGSDFVGHIGGDQFIIISNPEASPRMKERLIQRFDDEVKTFYNFKDRELGYILVDDGRGDKQKVPLMTLAVGLVHHDTAPFADIREITEVAAEARRRGQPGG
ncbi:MAG: response regulator [Anaerolineae bacterium]|jgi:diguanylate cyclase (GGDEF)-like protein|nr:response regulator [Anaerolineae bacterium]